MNKKFVIYTVLTGNYDDILQPEVVDDRFDYILFSNDIFERRIGIWTIQRIPNVIENDNKRLSRYPKTHPETLLSQYEASLYIDANVQIISGTVYDRFIELYESRVEYAGIKLVLTGRDCIYDHAFDMSHGFCVEHDYVAIRQCRELYKLGFPRHWGLNENNIIFRIHTERMANVDAEWWNWIVNWSSRDQLSYMYCLWKNKIPITYFLPAGEDTYSSKNFNRVYHDRNKQVIKTKVIKRRLCERVRVFCMSFDKNRSCKLWHTMYASSHPIFVLHFYGILIAIINVPKILLYYIKKR